MLKDEQTGYSITVYFSPKNVVQRALYLAASKKIAGKMLTAPTEVLQEKHFTKFDKLDQERVEYMCAAKNVYGLPPPKYSI